MRKTMLFALLAFPMQTACAQESPAAEAPAEQVAAAEVSDEDIFTAAGFAQTDGAWSKCGDPGTLSYTPGAIEQRGDFNADGRPDAVVTEGSVYCFGQDETGYTLVSQQAGGNWAIIDERSGIAHFLETKGTGGWPDISVGGPGFCFPVVRWDGKEYAFNRSEYEGAACRN